MVRALLANPMDGECWQAYIDWLRENDRDAEADYIQAIEVDGGVILKELSKKLPKKLKEAS